MRDAGDGSLAAGLNSHAEVEGAFLLQALLLADDVGYGETQLVGFGASLPRLAGVNFLYQSCSSGSNLKP